MELLADSWHFKNLHFTCDLKDAGWWSLYAPLGTGRLASLYMVFNPSCESKVCVCFVSSATSCIVSDSAPQLDVLQKFGKGNIVREGEKSTMKVIYL